jgi:hypothetical protein
MYHVPVHPTGRKLKSIPLTTPDGILFDYYLESKLTVPGTPSTPQYGDPALDVGVRSLNSRYDGDYLVLVPEYYKRLRILYMIVYHVSKVL